MSLSTGDSVFDEVLRGGFPETRSVLLTGQPGTGKSTLAMQFLQAGLENDEDCLYISTEQSMPELRDSFAPFDFDLDADGLTVTTIHGSPGYTIEHESEELTLTSIEGDDRITEGFSAPFTATYLHQFLESYIPCDRVVFDSVSGLVGMHESPERFRRGVIDLIRLFTDRYEATSVFTAEEPIGGGATGMPPRSSVAQQALLYNVHGVVRLFREAIRGEDRRFLKVLKMRGVDHDTRRYEIEFGSSGIRIVPRSRTSPDPSDVPVVSTGVPELDALCGGGFIQHGTVVLEHDGRAWLDDIVGTLLATAFEHDASVVHVPSVNTTPRRLRELFRKRTATIESLLESDDLFVIDPIGVIPRSHRNVFDIRSMAEDATADAFERAFETVAERRNDGPLYYFIHTGAAMQALSADELRYLRYWTQARESTADQTAVFVHDPTALSDSLAQFFRNDAQQIFETWQHESGLQYLSLSKSPRGYVGSTRLVEYLDEPPYLRLTSR